VTVISPTAALIRELTRSAEWDWDLPDLKRRARHDRRMLVGEALQKARDEFLPAHSGRHAARVIADAIHGRGTGDLALKMKLRRFLTQELGRLDDLPDWSRIRQLIDQQ
jgi:hypothetical protein